MLLLVKIEHWADLTCISQRMFKLSFVPEPDFWTWMIELESTEYDYLRILKCHTYKQMASYLSQEDIRHE